MNSSLIIIIYPTHLTFVYTGSVSCSKPLRTSKVCFFIQKKHLQKNESMLDSPVPLFRTLAFLGLFLLGRQVLFSLFQDVFNVLDFVQRFNFLLEYSAMIFRYEISLVEGLHNNHQVGLYLRDLHVCVVFCVVLYNIFKFAAQSFLVQFGLKLFFRDHLSNFASLLFNLTQCLHVSFDQVIIIICYYLQELSMKSFIGVYLILIILSSQISYFLIFQYSPNLIISTKAQFNHSIFISQIMTIHKSKLISISQPQNKQVLQVKRCQIIFIPFYIYSGYVLSVQPFYLQVEGYFMVSPIIIQWYFEGKSNLNIK
ncbi:Hypothetical_protein [Hexamita inflata]|uniref:Hypothetical_protein n=1 Tax=Hexamita inflata TaxID=28002 RepID=A0AA86Q612_9EUKA|nr:Hypothetical protein HINF_LOCUS34164 [Hexamita inflata]